MMDFNKDKAITAADIKQSILPLDDAHDLIVASETYLNTEQQLIYTDRIEPIFAPTPDYRDMFAQITIYAVRQFDCTISFFRDMPVYNPDTLLWEGKECMVPVEEQEGLYDIAYDAPKEIRVTFQILP